MTTAGSALAAAAASLVVEHDVVGTLTTLVADCAEVLGAGAAGLMLSGEDGPLEVVASWPHHARDLEDYEVQADEGPCLDAFRTGEVVHLESAAAALERWPAFGPRLVAAGLASVHACPMRWHGSVIGALNVFLAGDDGVAPDLHAVVQAFADVATVVVVHAGLPPVTDVWALTHSALESRTVIEQAKGVVAAQRDIDVDQAFGWLMAEAARTGRPLDVLARAVIQDAVQTEQGA